MACTIGRLRAAPVIRQMARGDPRSHGYATDRGIADHLESREHLQSQKALTWTVRHRGIDVSDVIAKTAEGTAEGDGSRSGPGTGRSAGLPRRRGQGRKSARGPSDSAGELSGQTREDRSEGGCEDAALTHATEVRQAQSVTDAKEKVAKILELIQENPGHPMNAAAYAVFLGTAEAAGLGPEEVRAQIEKWVDEARPYGPEWTGEVQSRALKALQGKKAYAALATEMAVAAEKALPADASLELRGNIVTMLARSARLAGKDEIAAEAESRAKVIDGKLDAEYHEKVPPFKPETFAGRKRGQGEPRRRHGDLHRRRVPALRRRRRRLRRPARRATSRPSSSACSTTCTSPAPTP